MSEPKRIDELLIYRVFKAYQADPYQSNDQMAKKLGTTKKAVDSNLTYLRKHKFDVQAAREAQNRVSRDWHHTANQDARRKKDVRALPAAE